MLSSRQLDAFQVLSGTLHFARAAEQLCITQSALSQRIKKLEETLGQRLFDRCTATVSLTDAGFRLAQYCRARSEMETELVNDLGAQGRGRSLGGVISVWGFSSIMRSVIYPALAPLIRSSAAVRFDLQTRHMFELEDALIRGDTEFIVTAEPIERTGYRTVLLGEEHNVLINGRQTGARMDLHLDHNVNDHFTETFFTQQDLDCSKGLRRSFCSDIYGITDLVAAGCGVGVVPAHMIDDDPRVEIDTSAGVFQTPVFLHYPRRSYYSLLHEKVVEQLRISVPIALRRRKVSAVDRP